MTAVTPIAILRKMKEIIPDEKHWTKGYAAVDAAGVPIDASDQRASCFCTVGALDRALLDFGLHREADIGDVVYDAMNRQLARTTSFLVVPQFNDHSDTTITDVHRLIDGTIEHEEKKTHDDSPDPPAGA